MCLLPSDASDADASRVPPREMPQRRPRQERVRHVICGSLAGIDRTIKILHGLGYANPNDWRAPIHSGTASG